MFCLLFSGILQSDKLKQTGNFPVRGQSENLKLLAEIFFRCHVQIDGRGFHHSTDAFPRVLDLWL